MIRFDPNVGQGASGGLQQLQKAAGNAQQPNGFSDAAKALDKYLSSVDETQKSSDMSIQELLAGKNEDIASVVAAVAKADISFKVLVGVRNKLIEAYKQTMNMQL
jgi:flagellar hook-basal body complex protein FliE